MNLTLNPLEEQLARDLFRAGCQQVADLEIAAGQHAYAGPRGWDTGVTAAALRIAALDLSRAWAEWLPLVDYPRLIRSPQWAELLGERKRNFPRLGELAAVLVEQAIKYAGTGMSGPLEAAAVAYGAAVFEIVRGPRWAEDLQDIAAAESASST